MQAKAPPLPFVMSSVGREAPALILYSCLVNLLLLITAIYMLQIYDRVLTSSSLDTLVWLTVIAVFALAIYAVLEQARRMILGRIGTWLDSELTEPVIRRSMQARLTGATPEAGPRDVADLRGFLSGEGVLAFLDAPWSILFLAIIWNLHPALGMLATGGALALFSLALANDLLTRAPQQKAGAATRDAYQAAIRYIDGAETIGPLGMASAIFEKWRARQTAARADQLRLAERTTTILSISRALRLALQVFVLGLGAFFVLKGELTAGGMVGASIIMGRALAPVERAIAAWRQFVAARLAHRNLAALLRDAPGPAAPIALPRPTGRLAVAEASLVIPQTRDPVLRNVSFALRPGQTCAMVGASGSGKSSLCRLLVGAWKPSHGHVRLDGADVFTWDPEDLGRYIGYLPQKVELFPGTIGENIARFGNADSRMVIGAAQLAGVHELILRLPNGYETDVGLHGDRISLGQRQRLGLARALFGDPAFIVLDEPNSNLDNEGEQALFRALAHLKSMGRTLVIVTHRPGALQVADKVLVLHEGAIARFGDQDEVLRPLMAGDAQPHSSPGATLPNRSPEPLHVRVTPRPD